MRLADLTWNEAERAAPRRILAVPIGSTEQHGPHLPLSTDTDIAVALAEGLSRTRADVVVAPPVAYGSSGEHEDFPGTLSIGRQATEELLVELGRSAMPGFARMLLVCAHMGNVAPVRRAERRLCEEGRDVRAFFPRWPGDAHAGATETSLMLALAPDRVRMDRAEAGDGTQIGRLLPRLVAGGVRAVSPNGVLGDPRGASAEDGRRLLAAGVEQLAALAAEDGPECLPPPS